MVGKIVCVLLLSCCCLASTSEAAEPTLCDRAKMNHQSHPVAGVTRTHFGAHNSYVDYSTAEGGNLTFQFHPNTSISSKECNPPLRQGVAMVYVQLYGHQHPFCEDRFTLYPLISDNHLRVTHCYNDKMFHATITKKLAGSLYAERNEEYRVVAGSSKDQWIRIRHNFNGDLKFSLEDIKFAKDNCAQSFIKIEKISNHDVSQELHTACWDARKSSLEYTLDATSVNISFVNVAFNLRYQVVNIKENGKVEGRMFGIDENSNGDKEDPVQSSEKEQEMPIWEIVLFSVGGVIIFLGILAVICCIKSRKHKRGKQQVAAPNHEVEVRNKRLSELEGEYLGFEGPNSKFSFPDVPPGGDSSSRPQFPVPKQRSVDNSAPYDQVATIDHYDDMDGHGYASINDISQSRKSLRRDIEVSELDGGGQCYEMMSYYDQVCTGGGSSSSSRRPSYGYAEVKKFSQKSSSRNNDSSSLPDLLEDDYLKPRSASTNISASVGVLPERSSRKMNTTTRLGRNVRGNSTNSASGGVRYDSPRPSLDGMLHTNLSRLVLGKSAANSALELSTRYDSPRPSLDGSKLNLAMFPGHQPPASAQYDTVCGGV